MVKVDGYKLCMFPSQDLEDDGPTIDNGGTFVSSLKALQPYVTA